MVATTETEALTTTLRTLARDPSLEVKFGTNRRQLAPGTVWLPPVGHNGELPDLRGEADHAALMHRLHDAALHNTLSPSNANTRKVFDALEEARVDIIGSGAMQGVQHNLHNRMLEEIAVDSATPAQQDDVLAASLSLLLRQAMQSLPIPEHYAHSSSHWLQTINQHAAAHWHQLIQSMPDQEQFGLTALTLLETLALLEDNNTETETSSEPASEKTDAAHIKESAEQAGNSAEPANTETSDNVVSTTQTPTKVIHSEEVQQRSGKAKQEVGGAMPTHTQTASGMSHYHVFTHAHDQIINAKDLADDTELLQLRTMLEHKLEPLQSTVTKLAAKLQHQLLAQQTLQWQHDQEEGILDSKRLVRLLNDPFSSEYHKSLTERTMRNVVVSLLVDNSGSMRGRPILIAALSADILARTLERCGVKVEILGFTTREWKGGKSAKDWQKAGMPKKPGRLNDLRHIIYKSADTPWRRAKNGLGLMLKDGILKENIDGEALKWACTRLMARQEQRRILIILSDGAPVDDSTLSTNSSNYLDLHLRHVIQHIEDKSPVELLAIGIGHDVTRYYTHAMTLSDVDKLPEALVKEVSALFKTHPSKFTKN